MSPNNLKQPKGKAAIIPVLNPNQERQRWTHVLLPPCLQSLAVLLIYVNLLTLLGCVHSQLNSKIKMFLGV